MVIWMSPLQLSVLSMVFCSTVCYLCPTVKVAG
jgi:hypothetical protein